MNVCPFTASFLLHTLKETGVGEHTAKLDDAIRIIIPELDVAEVNSRQQWQHQIATNACRCVYKQR